MSDRVASAFDERPALAIDASIGGVPARELAATYGTPLIIMDLDDVALRIDALQRAFIDRGIAVAYAAKAFLVSALAEYLAATPLRLDVCSLGELVTAERGGFPAGRMYFHGVAKSDDELRAVAAGRVAFGVIDNAEELQRLAGIAAGGAPVDVMLRINTGIEAHTHEFVRTGGEDTKFGVPAADARMLIERVAALPQLRLIGLHAHVGSQIYDAAPLIANLDELLGFAATARAAGLPVCELNLGGGIGVEAAPEDPAPIDLDALARALAARAAGTPYRLAIEPGRAIAARAGTSLYRVMAVKQQGRRRFVVVDGGMNDNPRPLLYGAHHAADVVASAAGGPPVAATLAGRSCENDEIGEYLLPAELAAGDLIAMRYTGAYTFSMASNYNRYGKPAVVFVQDGSHRRAVRAESPEDVVRNDLA
jgi:diaminopimelate decarboxylase